jgi:cytochrome o ubiquinol oxidase operon protein cyoD
MSEPKNKKNKAAAYFTGFLLSLGLTVASFALVWRHKDSNGQVFSIGFLLAWIVALALVQLFIQLIFFLHLGRESKPRWNLSALAFAVIVVVILVFGSLWIMASLDYHGGHHSTPQTSDEYIIQDEGFHDH